MVHEISEELAALDAEAIIESVRNVNEDSDKQDVYLRELIALVLDKKDWQKAASLIQAINDPSLRVEQLLQIIKMEFDARRIDKVSGQIQMAKQLAYQCDASWQKAESLTHIAYTLAQIECKDESLLLFDEAIAIARLGESGNIQDGVDASSVLWEIAERLAVLGEFDKANQVANDINNPHKQQKAIDGVKSILQGGKSWFVQS